jgi:phage terminase large subunit-like protein
MRTAPALTRIVVGVDPKANAAVDSNTGIVAAGIDAHGHGYVLGDHSLNGSPESWAQMVKTTYDLYAADRVVVERNQGGDMVTSVLKAASVTLPIKTVVATRGKATRAEPIAAMYEQGRIHHVGTFAALEDELCTWLPGEKSPDRLDALVWALSEMMLHPQRAIRQYQG